MPNLARYQAQLKTVHIDAGQVYMGSEPVLVSTILGSCVAVCLYDRRTHMGAMCHGALPHAQREIERDPLRYVDEALYFMLDRYRRLGVNPHGLQAKVFGGAEQLGIEETDGYRSIGRQNLMSALETLGWYKLAPSAQDAGGSAGRRLFFAAHTGEVFVRRLGGTAERPPAPECG